MCEGMRATKAVSPPPTWLNTVFDAKCLTCSLRKAGKHSGEDLGSEPNAQLCVYQLCDSGQLSGCSVPLFPNL